MAGSSKLALMTIREKLEASGMEKLAGRRCVITGGASQMLGVSDLAGRMLSKQVRKGKPAPLPGLAEAASGPSFATGAAFAFKLFVFTAPALVYAVFARRPRLRRTAGSGLRP